MQEQVRNYQLDFLKLLFAVIIAICHTGEFIPQGSGIVLPSQMGFWGVHFFFIVSGLLMVNSLSKNVESSEKKCECGKLAFNYVVKRFHKIAIPYWTALLICVICFYGFCYRGAAITNLEAIIPEFFCITQAGIDTARFNGPTWYISAMLIVMLPMYYLLYRNRDFYLYIFCPLMALSTYGLMYHSRDSVLDAVQYLGYFDGGIVRAVCGICGGGIAYILSVYIIKSVKSKSVRIILTIAELCSYLIIFGLWFTPNQEVKVLYSIMFLMPFLVAIVFSRKSLLHSFFKKHLFRFSDSLSLSIYLNQGAALLILRRYLIKNSISYSRILIYYSILIIAFCLVQYLLIYLIKRLFEVLKVYFK